uniref:Uncharacterized protein n=1 Tax=Anguilla anguilla TaxID=7936 RepID=A0A0E9Q4Z0_ANGAN
MLTPIFSSVFIPV